jgi:hypothetical protein
LIENLGPRLNIFLENLEVRRHLHRVDAVDVFIHLSENIIPALYELAFEVGLHKFHFLLRPVLFDSIDEVLQNGFSSSLGQDV